MDRIRSYRDLEVWQKAMGLVEEVYLATKEFPKSEAFGLTGQLRRAVISIPSNIAEGHGRRSTKEYLQFLSTAHGSLMEVETQIMIAERLVYLEAATASRILDATGEVGRLLNGLRRSLSQRMKEPK